MSTFSPPTSELLVPESPHSEPLADVVRWGLQQLEMDLHEENGVGQLSLGEADRAAFGGQSTLQLALEDSADADRLEPIDFGSRFANWLIGRLCCEGTTLHVRPHDQPTAVKDISRRLFAAYQVDGGRMHLGGCQLADYPFLRLSFAAETNGQPTVRHIFVAHDGSSVSDRQVKDLGLTDVEHIAKFPPRIDPTALNALEAAGGRVAAQSTTLRDPSAAAIEPAMTAIVWVKHASGVLNFTIGENTVQLPFSGWAKVIRPQPFVAAESGASTFNLAATDDGRIDAAEQIATCQQSGRRVLRQDLVTCSVTGDNVLESLTARCPVSGQPTLTQQFDDCGVCTLRVSKSVLTDGTCDACRNLVKIKKDDPRLVWILGEYTGLDRWNRWQLAETQNAYIAQASGLMKQLLVVVDKESLSIRHLATANRVFSGWVRVDPNTSADLLE